MDPESHFKIVYAKELTNKMLYQTQQVIRQNVSRINDCAKACVEHMDCVSFSYSNSSIDCKILVEEKFNEKISNGYYDYERVKMNLNRTSTLGLRYTKFDFKEDSSNEEFISHLKELIKNKKIAFEIAAIDENVIKTFNLTAYKLIGPNDKNDEGGDDEDKDDGHKDEGDTDLEKEKRKLNDEKKKLKKEKQKLEKEKNKLEKKKNKLEKKIKKLKEKKEKLKEEKKKLKEKKSKFEKKKSKFEEKQKKIRECLKVFSDLD